MFFFILYCNSVIADCFENAGRDSYIDPDLLRAIARVESNFDHLAIGKNPTKGFGVGIMQIDSQHFSYLQKFDVSPELLLDKCINIYVGTYFLKLAMNRVGNNWDAVGAYNAGFSTKPRQIKKRQQYAKKVRKHYQIIKRKEKPGM
ncbi:lytic transglycosylase domain-containing protein [[Enterobacter] lignolyticus]|uniref:Lytic transglycosylase catalytic n=1 Tax=Enterobacter lignolyticus (strain SCF1) TaxID=701347 RepID=E3G6F2_ENTLS|nr:lytic transglycosylase domain-containing protein [[Enterobacter] lignolyticus]ADO47275.1 Lytic transglycosylase catalytic [[Enterobacter] lignolyticus SCF1]